MPKQMREAPFFGFAGASPAGQGASGRMSTKGTPCRRAYSRVRRHPPDPGVRPPVPAQHAAGGVVVLDHGLQVTGLQKAAPAGAVLLRPAVRLGGAGHRRLQRHVPPRLPQRQHRLGKIEVAPPGHAADKVAHTLAVGRLHCVPQLLLQRGAPGVRLVASPGQLLRPVAGKAAGARSPSHGCRPLSHFSSLL